MSASGSCSRCATPLGTSTEYVRRLWRGSDPSVLAKNTSSRQMKYSAGASRLFVRVTQRVDDALARQTVGESLPPCENFVRGGVRLLLRCAGGERLRGVEQRSTLCRPIA